MRSKKGRNINKTPLSDKEKTEVQGNTAYRKEKLVLRCQM